MPDKHQVSPDELLKRMKISKEEFDLYKSDVSKFFDGLDGPEKEFYVRNNARTAEQIAKSLGDDVTAKDIEQLFAGAPCIRGMFVVSCCKP
jgi:tellurite resistance protein